MASEIFLRPEPKEEEDWSDFAPEACPLRVRGRGAARAAAAAAVAAVAAAVAAAASGDREQVEEEGEEAMFRELSSSSRDVAVAVNVDDTTADNVDAAASTVPW